MACDFWGIEVTATCSEVGLPLSEVSTLSNGTFCHITPDGNTLFAGQHPYVAPLTDYNVFYKSLDNGISWSQMQEDPSFNSIGFGNFASFTSSYDGIILVGGADGGALKLSTNSGNTWTMGTSSNYREAACSYSGEKIFLTCTLSGANQFRRSSNYGATFTNSQFSADFLCCSSDASYVYLQTLSGFSRSTDFGATFTLIGQIYTSTDSGVSWTARESTRRWWGCASSADGTKLIAVNAQNGFIYTSTDSGINWVERGSNQYWLACASSSDGTKLLAIVDGGFVYTSMDSGITWTQEDSARNWWCCTISSDGLEFVAGVNSGFIYTRD